MVYCHSLITHSLNCVSLRESAVSGKKDRQLSSPRPFRVPAALILAGKRPDPAKSYLLRLIVFRVLFANVWKCMSESPDSHA